MPIEINICVKPNMHYSYYTQAISYSFTKFKAAAYTIITTIYKEISLFLALLFANPIYMIPRCL